MRFGISSYAFGWAVGFDGARPDKPMGEQQLLDAALQHGAAAVQIADNLPLEEFSNDRLSRLVADANAKGLALEIGASRLTVDRLALYADLARSVGSPFIRYLIDGNGYHPDLSSVADLIRECLPVLDNVVLAIENHDRFPARDLRRLVEQIDSPNVGICLDTSNSFGVGEGMETVLRELAPFAVNLHVKDFAIERIDTKMGFLISGRPAGSGQLNIPEVIDELHRHERCQFATLELWTPRQSTLEATIEKEAQWVSQSCRYLKPLLENR